MIRNRKLLVLVLEYFHSMRIRNVYQERPDKKEINPRLNEEGRKVSSAAHYSEYERGSSELS